MAAREAGGAAPCPVLFEPTALRAFNARRAPPSEVVVSTAPIALVALWAGQSTRGFSPVAPCFSPLLKLPAFILGFLYALLSLS